MHAAAKDMSDLLTKAFRYYDCDGDGLLNLAEYSLLMTHFATYSYPSRLMVVVSSQTMLTLKEHHEDLARRNILEGTPAWASLRQDLAKHFELTLAPAVAKLQDCLDVLNRRVFKFTVPPGKAGIPLERMVEAMDHVSALSMRRQGVYTEAAKGCIEPAVEAAAPAARTIVTGHIERQVAVRKPAGEALGAGFHGVPTKLMAVRQGSAMAAAGASSFVGRTVARVNGEAVGSPHDIARVLEPLADITSDVTFTFEPMPEQCAIS